MMSLDACVRALLFSTKNCTKTGVKSAHFGCTGSPFINRFRARPFPSVQYVLINQPMEVDFKSPPLFHKSDWTERKGIRGFDVSPGIHPVLPPNTVRETHALLPSARKE